MKHCCFVLVSNSSLVFCQVELQNQSHRPSCCSPQIEPTYQNLGNISRRKSRKNSEPLYNVADCFVRDSLNLEDINPGNIELSNGAAVYHVLENPSDHPEYNVLEGPSTDDDNLPVNGRGNSREVNFTRTSASHHTEAPVYNVLEGPSSDNYNTSSHRNSKEPNDSSVGVNDPKEISVPILEEPFPDNENQPKKAQVYNGPDGSLQTNASTIEDSDIYENTCNSQTQKSPSVYGALGKSDVPTYQSLNVVHSQACDNPGFADDIYDDVKPEIPRDSIYADLNPAEQNSPSIYQSLHGKDNR